MAKATKIHKLSALRLSEVSLVDRGAAPGARVQLFKRADVEPECGVGHSDPLEKRGATMKKPIDPDMDGDDDSIPHDESAEPAHKGEKKAKDKAVCKADDTAVDGGEPAKPDTLTKFSHALMESIRSIVDDATVVNKRLTISKTLSQFVGAVMEHTTGDPTLEQIAGEKPAPEAGAAGQKVAKTEDSMSDVKAEPKAEETINKADLPEPIRKHLESLEAIAKSAQDQAKAANERACAAESIAKAEAGARELVLLEKRAEAELPHLPGTAVEKAKVLKAVEGLEDAVKATVLSMLKSGNEAMKVATTEIGKSDGGALSVGGTAYAALEGKAAEIAKSNPTMSQYVAFAKACEVNPDLYKQYHEEQVRKS